MTSLPQQLRSLLIDSEALSLIDFIVTVKKASSLLYSRSIQCQSPQLHPSFL
jgi:hypothetical protein